MERIINSNLLEKPKQHRLFSLWTELVKADLGGTTLHQHVVDLARDEIMYVAGGTARYFMGYKMTTLTPTPESVPEFEKAIGVELPDLKADFEKAQVMAKEEINLDLDLDLIHPDVRKAAIAWVLLLAETGERGLKTDMHANPLRYSISTTNPQSQRVKIDVTGMNGNARVYNENQQTGIIGKFATTFDGLAVFPVDKHLNVQVNPFITEISSILGVMTHDTSELAGNTHDKLAQAVAIRLITQSLLEKGGERVELYLGEKNEEDMENIARWLLGSLTHIIVKKEKDPKPYRKLLYAAVPNWDKLDERLKRIIKSAFITADKIRQETKRPRG